MLFKTVMSEHHTQVPLETLKKLLQRPKGHMVIVIAICLPTEHQRAQESSFIICPCIPDRIGIWKCWFLGRGENRSTRRKTSRSRDENQQTQPTYGAKAGNQTRARLVGGECSHHCAIPAPLNTSQTRMYSASTE